MFPHAAEMSHAVLAHIFSNSYTCSYFSVIVIITFIQDRFYVCTNSLYNITQHMRWVTAYAYPGAWTKAGQRSNLSQLNKGIRTITMFYFCVALFSYFESSTLRKFTDRSHINCPMVRLNPDG